jgi:mono/diheme cytochrome c family protein
MQLKVVVGGYTTPCGDGPVESAITHVKPDGTAVAVAPMLHAALAVDVALSPDGSQLAFASAGRKIVETMPIAALSAHDDDECGDPQDNIGVGVIDDELGMPTSVAYAPNGDLLVYYPELPALVVHHGDSSRTIRLPGPFGYDAGRAMFHRQTRSGMACASCHPEGREDGQVWEFGFGPRRTQSLAGGILARAPFHWSGDMADIDQLMTDVFERRMAAFTSTHSERVSLGPWLDRIPAPAPVIADEAAIARGEALFTSPEQGCLSCHQGESFTTNALADVGTGGVFKTPSLIGVGARAPFLHNGCALTLRDRFGVCGGGEAHGRTAHLTQDEISDLVAYLESL